MNAGGIANGGNVNGADANGNPAGTGDGIGQWLRLRQLRTRMATPDQALGIWELGIAAEQRTRFEHAEQRAWFEYAEQSSAITTSDAILAGSSLRSGGQPS